MFARPYPTGTCFTHGPALLILKQGTSLEISDTPRFDDLYFYYTYITWLRGLHTRISAPRWHESPGALCHPMPKDTSSMSQACLAKLTRPENNGANFNGNNNKKIVVTFNFQKKRANVRGSTGTCYHILSAPINIGDNISEHRHIIWDR